MGRGVGERTLQRVSQEKPRPPIHRRSGGRERPSPFPSHRGGPAQVASDGRVGPRGRRGAGGCWSTRPGGPSSRLESAATVTPSQTCTPNLKRQQEAPTPGRHRDSRHQRRLAPGTLPRARRPSHSPHEGRRRSSRDKGQYKSGRQVAPDNRLRRPRAGSRSPAGHRGRCSAAGPPKRPSSARGEAAGVWRGPEASVSELAPGSARHGATPAADGVGGRGGGSREDVAGRLPRRRSAPHAIPGRGEIPRRHRRCPGRLARAAQRGTSKIPGCPDGGREGGREGGRKGRRGLANRNQASAQRTTQEFILSRTEEVFRKQTRKAQKLERKGRIHSDPHTNGNKHLSVPRRRQSPKTTRGCVGGGKCTCGHENMDYKMD